MSDFEQRVTRARWRAVCRIDCGIAMKKIFKYLGYAAVATLVARKESKEDGNAPAPAPKAAPPPEKTTNVIEHRPDEGVPKGAMPILKRTFSDFMDDDCMSLGATV